MNFLPLIAAIILATTSPQMGEYTPILLAYDTQPGSPHHAVVAYGFPPGATVGIRADGELKRMANANGAGHIDVVIELERRANPRVVEVEVFQPDSRLSVATTTLVAGTDGQGWSSVTPTIAGRGDFITVEGHSWERDESINITYAIGSLAVTKTLITNQWGGWHETWRIPGDIKMGQNLRVTIQGHRSIHDTVIILQPSATELYGDPAEPMRIRANNLEPNATAELKLAGEQIATLSTDRQGSIDAHAVLDLQNAAPIQPGETVKLTLETEYSRVPVAMTPYFPELDQ